MADSAFLAKVKHIYETKYKLLLILPFVMLLLSIIVLGINYARTGEIIERDISLKGGMTLTLSTTQAVDLDAITQGLTAAYPENEFATKSISSFGRQTAVLIESDLEDDRAQEFIQKIGQLLGRNLDPREYTVEIIGSSLGTSFFKDLVRALLIAFVFMAIVVFIFFRKIGPSLAVILAAFTDLIVTVAIVSMLGLKISGAGIAAFLMLIGYGVDTNILLSTNAIKRQEGTLNERIYNAFSTGLTMVTTTIIACIIGLLVVKSDVITQIMTILLIGLMVDFITTWIMNVGILRILLARKKTQ